MTLVDDANLEEFVITKDEFSGADIKAICTEAGLLTLQERHMKVSLISFLVVCWRGYSFFGYKLIVNFYFSLLGVDLFYGPFTLYAMRLSSCLTMIWEKFYIGWWTKYRGNSSLDDTQL